PPPPLSSTPFPYTTLFRSQIERRHPEQQMPQAEPRRHGERQADRDSHRGELEPFGENQLQDLMGARAERAAHGELLPPLLHAVRSEEHTSELQSRRDLVCR